MIKIIYTLYHHFLEKAKSIYNTIPNLGFLTPKDNRGEKNACSLSHYVENILKNEKYEWYKLYRSFNKIDEDLSLELHDFEIFYERRKNTILHILIEKLDLDREKETKTIEFIEDEYPDIEDADSLDIITEISIHNDDTKEFNSF